ncbi:DNA recombination protein RmuC [Microbacterium schleiferi]|uniref:DNA recombination protein RmuC n=1 Tax=Microbacterium schleiferi TaxID=69362 RepID=UPI00311E4F11
MDALLVSGIILGSLAAGLIAGWAFGAAGARARSMAQLATVREQLAATSAAHDATLVQLAQQKEWYRDLVAQTRSDQAAREERERREQSVLRALEPVRETLQSMQVTVAELERERQNQYGTIAEQLRRAQQSDEALRATTESLASALRSGSTRGVWGETQLRRVVEAAGLTRHVDFDIQSTIETDAGAGRPDMIIRLPGDKAIAVDAKVPLDAYLEAAAVPETAVGAEAASRRALMDKHVKAMRAHVDALAKKTYWAGLSSSPEFVICFVPSESLLSTALDADPTLLDYAFGRRVALASPVNLWAVLKTVAYTWTQQDVTADARRLFDLGNELFTRLGGLASHANDLRRSIERTVESFNRFAGTLESRVLVTARKFPGIDDTKLDAVTGPAAIESTPRHLTAIEFLDPSPERGSSGSEVTTDDDPTARITADLGEVRGRIQAPTHRRE